MKLGLRDVGYYTKKDVAPYPIEPNGKSSFLKSDKKPKKAKYKIYVTKSMKLEHNQGFQALIVLSVDSDNPCLTHDRCAKPDIRQRVLSNSVEVIS